MIGTSTGAGSTMRAVIIGLFMIAIAIGWRSGGTSRPAAPAQPVANDDGPHGSPGSITLDRTSGSHFFVTGDVNGKPLRFVVDTGATTVAIGRDDAERLGLGVDDSAYTLEMQTAGGPISGAKVTLPSVRVGDIELLDVSAVVLDVRDTMPMLGQSFLSRLDSVSIERDRMTLTKR
jgi:aspartyl protease family protein